MGEIFVAVVKVAGDSETINRALSMASEVITGKSAPSASVELAALPIAALPAAAPVNDKVAAPVSHRVAKIVSAGKGKRKSYSGPRLPCDHCDRTFGSPQARGKHISSAHPDAAKKKSPTAADPSAKVRSNSGARKKTAARSSQKLVGAINIYNGRTASRSRRGLIDETAKRLPLSRLPGSPGPRAARALR